jgi:hypothetical protein
LVAELKISYPTYYRSNYGFQINITPGPQEVDDIHKVLTGELNDGQFIEVYVGLKKLMIEYTIKGMTKERQYCS